MKRRGFTLIEMIVVVSIIGLLAAAATLAYNKQRVRSREVKRIADVSSVKDALELYLTDGSVLPSYVSETLISIALSGLVTKGYIPSLPNDPLPSGATDHTYCTGYAYWTNADYGSTYTFKGQAVGVVRYAVNFGAEMVPIGDNIHPINSQIFDRSTELNCSSSRYQASLFEK